MIQLFNEMRESCERKTWARGLELTRQKCIFDLGMTKGTRKFVVREASKGAEYLVVLNSLDMDWSCNCGEDDSPCTHACAAVQAWKQESEGVKLSMLHDSKWSVSYQIETEDHLIYIIRSLVRGSDRIPLPSSLAKCKSDSVMSLEISINSGDLNFERVLPSSEISKIELSLALFQMLGGVEVFFENRLVKFDSSPRGCILSINKESGGIRLLLKEEIGVFFKSFFFLNDTFYPLASLGFSERETSKLRKGTYLGAKEALEFYSSILPKVRGLVPIEDSTEQVGKQKVQVAIDSWEENDQLFYRYLLAYGEPPLAIIESNQMRLLGGSIPIRSESDEMKALVEFERATGAELQKIYSVGIPEAFKKSKQLLASKFPVLGHGLECFSEISITRPEVKIVGGEYVLSTPLGSLSIVKQRDSLASHGFFKLDSGRWVEFPKGWLEGEGQKIMDILLVSAGKVSKGSLIALQSISSVQNLSPDFLDIAERWDKNYPIFETSINLRAYQKVGAQWLAKLQSLGLGGVLADEMGLGKTYQTLVSLKTPALIVAPTSLLGNWLREAALARPELKSSLIHDSNREWSLKKDLYITSYGTIRSDITLVKSIAFKTIVLDEAQHIKNPSAKTTLACFELNSEARIALSGTPIENSITDLWSIMNFCLPGFLGPLEALKDRSKSEDLVRLKQVISPFILRRVKKDVASDLPERILQIVRCTMEDDQKVFYQSLLSKVKEQIGDGERPMDVLTALLRLRQAACDPFLVDLQTEISSTKLDYLETALKEIVETGQSALVFSQWTGLLDRVEQRLRVNILEWSRLDGSTLNRDQVVDDFMSGKSNIMLISLKAGGTGLNLTRADHVFILDPWWNPAVEEQAIARAHRIGRKGAVFIHRLVTEETVEEKIVALQTQKNQLADFFLEDSALSSSLSFKEFKDLIF
jgi:superfamily II DNA or RNA helicase